MVSENWLNILVDLFSFLSVDVKLRVNNSFLYWLGFIVEEQSNFDTYMQ